MKICSMCQVEQPTSAFSRSATGRDGLTSRCRSCLSEIGRARYHANRDVMRESKRIYMAQRRADPVTNAQIRRSGKKCYDAGGREKQRARMTRMRLEDPFRFKARMLRHQNRLGWPITADQVREMWESQGGTCPLTDVAMDVHDAEVDHIVPRSRGGSHDLPNLRWLSRAANQAKGDLLDAEFIALCQQVVAMAALTHSERN